MLAVLGLGHVKGTGLKNAATLAGLLFQFPVQLHGVVLELRDVVVVVQPVEIGSRVPGGARGEFIALEKNHVFPPQLGEMIEDGTADETASNDDRLCM